MALAALVLAIAACGTDSTRPALPGVEWVPFSARFTSVSGSVESQGRFFRHRDGSTRRDTLAADGTPAFVTIENRRASRFYSFSSGSWTAQPMRLPPWRLLPPTGADFPSAMPLPDAIAGYRVVRADTALGTVMHRAPALNYFPLAEDHPYPVLHVTFADVVRGDVDATVFAPPSGAAVAELPWEYSGGL
jgi:hypothetical protein